MANARRGVGSWLRLRMRGDATGGGRGFRQRRQAAFAVSWRTLPFMLACFVAAPIAAQENTSERPVVEAIIDHESGETLWSVGEGGPTPTLSPGQRIILAGRHFGPGPITAAVPGVKPPAGGTPLAGQRSSVAASPEQAEGRELSKVLFGRVRALERNISSYRARIDLETIASTILHRLQGEVLDYFVEDYEEAPDTWAGDIYGWSDRHIDLTVPASAYEGPISVIRIPTSSEFIGDIKTGDVLRYRDPNTARVVTDSKNLAFNDGWRIARTRSQPVLASDPVLVAISQNGTDRFRYAAPASAETTDEEEQEARRALLADGPLTKSTPTGRSAADQYAYGEKTYWAWDWNLALPHFILGVDWDGIFGFENDREGHFLEFVRSVRHAKSDLERPRIEEDGYEFPVLDPDGDTVSVRHHRAIVDRQTGSGVRPFTSFGAVPLLPERGVGKLVVPRVVYGDQLFRRPTPYPIEMAINLPFSEPLTEGLCEPTGWVGYVRTEFSNPVPGGTGTVSGIGFACAACHAQRVTFEYNPEGDKVTKIFNGVPNPDWKATFLTLSGRTHGLSLDEELPINFIRNDHPEGIQSQVKDDFRVRLFGLWADLGVGGEEQLQSRMTKVSAEHVDKTLLIYNLPPGTTESTFFNESNQPSDYSNDYFFSPQAIPIITNHTPVRRALSHSELLDGFEGAYLHGEEPEGARGPMSSRSLQDLTLYASTLGQEDELLRRIGLYRWLSHKELLDLLAEEDEPPPNEGTFVSVDYPLDEITSPPAFPPKRGPSATLATVRDRAIADDVAGALDAPLAQRYPKLAEHIVSGAAEFRAACARCHTPGHAGLWTNEDMHPISAAGGEEPVGRFFTPAIWQRRTQSVRVAILQNLYWVQQRGLLSDGHVHDGTPENMDGLELLVHPDRCDAALRDDGSIDLDNASNLYKGLYTIHGGKEHSFRIPSAGMRFELMARFGPERGAIAQVEAEDTSRMVTEEEEAFVRRHAYFTKQSDGYYYWDYQKMRLQYGILEYGLDPTDFAQAQRIGGLPVAPHPWCMAKGASQQRIDDLVLFLLTL